MAYAQLWNEVLEKINAVTDEDIREMEKELDRIKPTDKVLGVASEDLRRLFTALNKMGPECDAVSGTEKEAPHINLAVVMMILFFASIQKEFHSYDDSLIAINDLGLNEALNKCPHKDLRCGWVVVRAEAEFPDVVETDLPNLTEALVDPDDDQIDNFENEGGKTESVDRGPFINPPSPPEAERYNEDDDRPDEETRRVTGFSC